MRRIVERKRRRALCWVSGGVLALLIIMGSGCASTGSGSNWTRTGDPLIDGRLAISNAPPKDRVLWQYRTALEALRRNQHAEAKQLLDDAILTIGGIRTGDKSAKRARSYFHEEAKKTFLGEPYERVMAYYYRGILYWMDGEPDNARACFRNAQLQDSDTERREYSSDYVLLDFLEGLATQKLGGDPSDAYKRARKASHGDVPPEYPNDVNSLFFVEMGRGPTKFSTGEFNEELRFRDGHSSARAVRIRVGDAVVTAAVYDNLSFQASTRGGRIMDHVLANKAVFKSGADTFGNAALIGGMVMAPNRQHQDIALGLVAAGLMSKIISAATTPSADTRSWDNLPESLTFAALKLPPGQYEATVEFLDGAGHVMSGRAKTVPLTVGADEDAVVFVSDRS